MQHSEESTNMEISKLYVQPFSMVVTTLRDCSKLVACLQYDTTYHCGILHVQPCMMVANSSQIVKLHPTSKSYIQSQGYLAI